MKGKIKGKGKEGSLRVVYRAISKHEAELVKKVCDDALQYEWSVRILDIGLDPASVIAFVKQLRKLDDDAAEALVKSRVIRYGERGIEGRDWCEAVCQTLRRRGANCAVRPLEMLIVPTSSMGTPQSPI